MIQLTFRVDPHTRFPLVDVPGQGFALFWLPLTKVQIEYFLSDNTDRQFDRAWYRERLRAQPRVIPEKLSAHNLVQAFITSITFDEARVFSRWYGQGYDLPTTEEWYQALHIFEKVAADPAFIEQIMALPELHPRARLLIQACEKALPAYQRIRDFSEYRLSHQMMMSPGILEYVYQDGNHSLCAACGFSPHVISSAPPGQGVARSLLSPKLGDRMASLGVRPLLRW
jgi:hypothetical protein